MGFQSLMRLSCCLAIAVITSSNYYGSVNGEDLAEIVKPPGLRIGSFNIQIFGVTKFGKVEVVEDLVPIIHRFDIVLIMEIRDSSEEVIYEFLDRVNSGLKSTEEYGMTVSERLGRSSSKEQYAYMFRKNKVSLSKAYVYNDEQHDYFEREPYVAIFQTSVTTISTFALIGCHIKPSDAVNELNHMELVYDDLVNRNKLYDAIFMGDYNADCSYVSESDWDKVTFRHDKRFLWLIGDNDDTTVAHSSCAYDRFVIAGEGMARAYVPGSAHVFYFDSANGMEDSEAKNVSDHYPIQMDLMPVNFPGCPSKPGLTKPGLSKPRKFWNTRADILDDLLAEIEKEEEVELLMKMIFRSSDGL